MPLTMAGDITVPPTTHVVSWTGEFPHRANGEKLLALLHENASPAAATDSLPPAYQLSAKPPNGYSDYCHKVTTYIEILVQRGPSSG